MNTLERSTDPIMYVIEEEKKAFSSSADFPEWLRQYYRTYSKIMEKVVEGNEFMPKHHQAFLSAFDPFSNFADAAWRRRFVQNAKDPWNWNQFQVIHMQANAYAALLLKGSRQHHLAFANAQGQVPDKIETVILGAGFPEDAYRCVMALISDHHPYSHQHGLLFMQQFSPLYNKGHALWASIDPQGNDVDNWKKLSEAHLHAGMFNLQLAQASLTMLGMLRNNTIQHGLKDFLHLGETGQEAQRQTFPRNSL